MDPTTGFTVIKYGTRLDAPLPSGDIRTFVRLPSGETVSQAAMQQRRALEKSVGVQIREAPAQSKSAGDSPSVGLDVAKGTAKMLSASRQGPPGLPSPCLPAPCADRPLTVSVEPQSRGSSDDAVVKALEVRIVKALSLIHI